MTLTLTYCRGWGHTLPLPLNPPSWPLPSPYAWEGHFKRTEPSPNIKGVHTGRGSDGAMGSNIQKEGMSSFCKRIPKIQTKNVRNKPKRNTTKYVWGGGDEGRRTSLGFYRLELTPLSVIQLTGLQWPSLNCVAQLDRWMDRLMDRPDRFPPSPLSFFHSKLSSSSLVLDGEISNDLIELNLLSQFFTFFLFVGLFCILFVCCVSWSCLCAVL